MLNKNAIPSFIIASSLYCLLINFYKNNNNIVKTLNNPSFFANLCHAISSLTIPKSGSI